MGRMISELFQTVLGLSLVGSYVILLVLLVRLVLRKAPKWCSYLLWGVVFIRLMCPVFPEAQFSLIPRQLSNNAIVAWLEGEATGFDNMQIETDLAADGESIVGSMNASNGNNADLSIVGVCGADIFGNESISQEAHVQGNISDVAQVSGQQRDISDTIQASGQQGDISGTIQVSGQQGDISDTAQTPGQKGAQPIYSGIKQLVSNLWSSVVVILSCVWLAGAVLLAGYHCFSYWCLKYRVRTAKLIEPGVREVQGEHLSFVMGICKPTIYLSQGLDEESRRVVLCHERVHLQRRDYLIKPLALGICCMHWFNPLVWLAFCLMNKDCEMSCDERVVNLLGEGSKKIYSYALLDEATKGQRKYYHKGTVCALLSFGEDNVKNRISHVLQYKKASLWVVVGAVLAVTVVIIGLFANPGKEALTEEVAVELVQEAGAYAEDADTACFPADYEKDGKPEIFVEIGLKDDADRIEGDLWHVSEDGTAELLLEDKFFYRQQEQYDAERESLLLVNFVEGNPLQTIIYGVRDGRAEQVMQGQEQKYIEGEDIICVMPDYKLAYDIEMQAFSGHDQKKYAYYYRDGRFEPYTLHHYTAEEVKNYENGEELLSQWTIAYPNARFEYLITEQRLYVNIASVVDEMVEFKNMVYKAEDGKLELLEEGQGCYFNYEAAGAVSFAEQIAGEYTARNIKERRESQSSPEQLMEHYATAMRERDGNTLYFLSLDKNNFESWNMVIPLEGGGYAFGDSSPWVSSYDITYNKDKTKATIRFLMTNSIPEYYIAEEVVEIKAGELYYANHRAYTLYSEFHTREELEQVFDLEAEVPFADTGYDDSFVSTILQHILNKTNPEYYAIYTDPISSAKALLHLGEGIGEVTELLHGVKPQNMLSSGYGEGSVVNVRYTFKKDGSTVDIPMVLAEESEGIWVLYVGD